jgi:hypothetical protein
MSGSNTDVGTDIAVAGQHFGAMILSVGNAVATTQRQLAETSADTTSTLASTLVDVIAVQETIFDDNGTPTASTTFTRKLPLIDFVDPTLYQWTTVRLQGQFFVREIATAANAKTTSSSFDDHSSQAGLLLFFGGGQTGVTGSVNTTTSATTSDTAFAVGRARMYAQLNPRTDTGVPKPLKAVQGPSIQIVQGEIRDQPGGGVTPLTGRTCSLLLQLRRFDASPIPGKTLSVETDGVPWTFTAGSTTGADGNVAIQLQRAFLPPPTGVTQDVTPVPIVVTVRLGIVTNSVTVTF